jgi:outer membrane immunogenic protein
MNKLFFLGASTLALVVAQSAVAADFPMKAPTFAERFTWTGCYLGGHVGGAWQQKDATDPVLLVQDNAAFGTPGNTVGTTTARVNSSGAIYGGQIGCDYQFAPSWVVGVEGAVSAGSLDGSTRVPFQAAVAFPGETELVRVRTDFIPTVTARLGYAVDHWLFYGKGGIAWTNDKYSITGTFTGVPFDAEGLGMRTGWTAGAGAEWAFTNDWSARLEYDYYDFGRANVLMIDPVNNFQGIVSFKQTAQMVKLGLNFRVGQ